MGVGYPTKLLLAHRNGGVCALPGCDCRLTADNSSGTPIHVGEAAHQPQREYVAGDRTPPASGLHGKPPPARNTRQANVPAE